MSTDTVAPALPDEVVTHARLRLMEMPQGAGTLALITLDNDRDHTRPSTFGPAGLAELDAAIDAAVAAPGVAAIAVTGKPFIFAVGADLSATDQRARTPSRSASSRSSATTCSAASASSASPRSPSSTAPRWAAARRSR